MAARKKSKIPDPMDCTMSLGDHLEELRTRLILAILGLFIGAIASLIFGTHILAFIQKPYVTAMQERRDKGKARASEPNLVDFFELFFDNVDNALLPDPNAPATDANTPAIDPNGVALDPNELAFFRRVCVETAHAWMAEHQPEKAERLRRGEELIVIGVPDAFSSYMKIALISGLILTCPWVFYQLWMFVAAGLYEHERKYVRTAVPFSAALFIAGALFFLFVVARISLRFFLFFGDLLGVAPAWTLQKYVSFVTMLMLVFGLGFQTPIAVFILARTGLVSLEALRSVRKYVFLAVFIVAAAVTPPDVISQVTLGLPLYGLYELGMLLALIAARRAKERELKEKLSASGDKKATDATSTVEQEGQPQEPSVTDEEKRPDAPPPVEEGQPDTPWPSDEEQQPDDPEHYDNPDEPFG
jgi:sec-independent protein translocase protein TatC